MKKINTQNEFFGTAFAFKRIAFVLALVLGFVFVSQQSYAQTDVTVTKNEIITIESGSFIYTTGTFTLKSPTNSGAGASLVDKNTDEVTSNGVRATTHVERFLSKGETHYIASPVQGETAGVITFGAVKPYAHSESADWTDSWTQMDATATLDPATGYAIGYYGAYQTPTFEGNLHTGDIDFTLSYTANPNNADSKRGWNLIGNPYPSAINWDNVAGWDGSQDIYSAVYVWDNNQYKAYIPEDNPDGGTFAPSPAVSTGGSNIIPAMQGFMVKAKSASNGSTFTIPNGARVHDQGVIFSKDEEIPLNQMRITAYGSEASDQAVIRFLEGATGNFDGTLDAFQMGANPEVPQIYAIAEDNTKLTISSLPLTYTSNSAVPLGFKVGTAGTYTIEITEMNFGDNPIPIIFEDTWGDRNGEEVKIPVTQDFSYQVTAEQNDVEWEGRFILHFDPLTTDVEEIAPNAGSLIDVYSNKKDLYINLEHSGYTQGTVTVYSLLGNQVLNTNLNSTLTHLKVDAPTGAYIVKVTAGGETHTEKVFIQ